MAIVIPSSSIYEITNEKIKDNIIKRVDFSVNDVNISNQYNTQVHSQTVQNFPDFVGTFDDLDYSFYLDNSNKYLTYSYAYLSISPIYIQIPPIKIPKLNTSREIINLVTTEGNLVSYTVSYKLNKGKAKGTIKYGEKQYNTNGTLTASFIKNATVKNTWKSVEEESTEGQGVLGITNEYKHTFNSKYWQSYDFTASAITDFVDNTKLPTNAIYEDGNYILKTENTDGYLTILCGARIYKLGYGEDIYQANGLNISAVEITANGTYEEYIPYRLDISVNGDTISLELNERNLTVGDETSTKSFSVEGNELVQYTNSFVADANHIYEKDEYFRLIQDIFTPDYAYGKGKETAVIRCSINDYYDEDGTQKIYLSPKGETDPMTFTEGDEVIPMKYDEKGNDKPMSQNTDGSRKVFKVLGTEKKYDGAVFQILTLQEK